MNFEYDINNRMASREDILLLEKIIGIKLPKDYSDFLERNTGGRPLKNTFNLFSEEEYVDDLFSINYLLSWKGADYFGSPKQTGYMVIGMNPGGDVLIMSVVDREERGNVYLWDHDENGDEYKASYDNLYFVASSFKDFIALLEQQTEE